MYFKKLLAFLFALCLVFEIHAQTKTNTRELLEFSSKISSQFEQKKAEAKRIANQNNLPLIIETPNRFMELMFFDDNGNPQYYTTTNVNAASTISTDELHSDGSSGFELEGNGMEVQEWDAGAVLTSHQEFDNRVIQVDNSSVTHYHSTHVAGTLIASGAINSATGMAPMANLRAFDWNNDDSEMAAEAAEGALVSNHSYSFGRGWTDGIWYGDPDISKEEDYLFGFYDSYCASWDIISQNAPYYLIVKSAGNDRNDCGDGSYPCDGPYDCIGQRGVAKNILTVGAVSDIPNGYSQPSDVVMSVFSSWGPADDGRIKPDIVANGTSLYSTHDNSNSSYSYLSGTSMASPSAAGSLILLQELYESIHGSNIFMTSASLKALVIHTADEAGDFDGPDYQFGWGLMNSLNAAEKINEDAYVNVMDELNLSDGSTFQRTVKAVGNVPLKVTIVWTDEAGAPPIPSLDPADVMLVNDLDLRITQNSNTFYPWKLNKNIPEASATRDSKNNVDNVEVVTIDNPLADTDYTIIVDHSGNLQSGSQDFSIIISGIKQQGSLFFSEDWESQNGISQNIGPIYSCTDFSWSFETDRPEIGRVRWGTNAQLAHSGDGAITLDVIPETEANVLNSAILTIDLSTYSSSEHLDLDFWWTDHGEEKHNEDKVWIRGSDEDNWLEIYDFNVEASEDNTFQKVSGLDIDVTLGAALPPQSVSNTFQVKFAQFDNEIAPDDGITIDDIRIFVDNCYSPTEILTANITNNSAELSWSEVGSATSWKLLLNTVGADTSALTPITLYNNNYSWSNLDANTTYEWYVSSICNETGQSVWSGPHVFTTNFCNNFSSAILPFTEDWETEVGTLVVDGPVCCETDHSWNFKTNSQNGGRLRWGTDAFQTHLGSGAMTMDKNVSGGYAINYNILTINLEEYISSSDLALSFWWTDHGDEEHNNDKVWIRGSNTDHWLVIYDFDPASATDGIFNHIEDLDIDSLLNNGLQQASSSFQIRFGQEDNYSAPSDGLTIDDITITGTTCLSPSNTLASNISQTSASLSWDENGEATSWEILIGNSGFDTSGITPIVVDSNPILWEELSDNTEYNWYVRAFCGDNNTSIWKGPYTFSTLGYTRKLPYLTYDGDKSKMQLHWQLFEAQTSIVEWGTDTTYGTTFSNLEYGNDHQHEYIFTGLLASTPYYYNLTTGNETFTGSFMSAPSENATNVSFYAYGDHRTFPERHDSVAAKIIDDLSNSIENQTFILSTGDIVSNGNNESDWDEQLFNTGFDNITHLMANIPFQGVMGNHENDGLLFAKYLPYSFPEGGGENGNYYSFDYGNVHFSMVDQYTDYSFGSIQYNWLVNDLSTTQKPWKIIALHEPGWAAGHHENNIDVQTIIQSLCETYNVQVVFAGHNHYYARAEVNGTNHITTGGGGSNLYNVDTTYPNLVVAEKAYHFCKIQIEGNTLQLLAINRDGDTIDNFTIENNLPQHHTPIAHWPADEGSGTVVEDVSENTNDGTLINGTAWGTGISGTALSFDGVDDKVDAGNANLLDMGTGDFSIASWVKMGADQVNYPTIAAKGGGASYDMGYWMFVRSNRLRLYISNGTSRINAFSNVVGITDDSWHHIAASVDRDDYITFYVDGEPAGNFDISDFDGENINSIKSLTMGRWQNSSSTALKGELDDIRLYDVALSDIKIGLLFSGDTGENNAPVIQVAASANPDTITLPDSTLVQLTAYDPDGDILTYSWVKLSGPGDVDFTPNNSSAANNSMASFSVAGDYILRIFVFDDADTVSNDVSVSVTNNGDAPEAIAHWPADEGSGTVVEDVSENTNDGTLINGTAWGTGISGTALSFDGVDDKVDACNDPLLNMGTGDFSIASWVKMGADQVNYPTIAAKGGGASYDMGYWMFVLSNRLRLYISNGSSRINAVSNVVGITDDSWHHIAASVDRDNDISFYVDGEPAGSFDISDFDGENIISIKSLTLGMLQNSSSTAFKGELDDIRLYDVALSDIEIGLLFNEVPGENNAPVIQVAASANPDTITLPDSTLAQVTAYDPDGDILTYSWLKLSGPGDVDFTPNNSSAANNSMASFSVVGDYILRVFVFDDTDTVSNDVSVSVTNNGDVPEAIAHWPADEGSGTVVEDVSENTNDGTLINGTAWGTGISGTALSFDGVDDKVDAGNANLMDMGTGDFSIASWVKMGADQANYPTIAAKGGGASYDMGYWMFVLSNRLRLYISNGSSRINAFSNVVSITDDSWHHIAASVDRDADITFYVDGEPAGSFDISDFNGENITSNKSLTMGSWQNSLFSFFKGDLDEVQIFDIALSETLADSLYNLYSTNKKLPTELSNITGFNIFPNPFFNSANLIFSISDAQKVNITIYDIHGNPIKVISDQQIFKGRNSIHWDGRDERSNQLPTGFYIVRIVTETDITQKIILKSFN